MIKFENKQEYRKEDIQGTLYYYIYIWILKSLVSKINFWRLGKYKKLLRNKRREEDKQKRKII